MKRKAIFDMSYYDFITDGISFKGRALYDIQIGDRLIYLLNVDGKELVQEYVVIKMIAYRHEFDLIDAGLTCEIITIGEQIEFKSDRFLYIEYN